MPYSEPQRRGAWAALRAKQRGESPKAFKGMSAAELERYAKAPLHKPSASRTRG